MPHGSVGRSDSLKSDAGAVDGSAMNLQLTLVHRRCRLVLMFTAVVLGAALLAIGFGPRIKRRDELLILATTGAQGRLEPAHWTEGKGGFARRATLRDSLAAEFDQLLLVDGGWFVTNLIVGPSDPKYREQAAFVMDCMTSLHTDAVGLSRYDLKFGRGWLLAEIERTHLPVVSANVLDSLTHRTLVPPYVIVKKGRVKVGVFSLEIAAPDLGPSRDSLTFEDPTSAAARVVPEMRRDGATVVVLLSQLPRAEVDELVQRVDGIDVVIASPGAVPGRGRYLRNTIVCTAEEQGHDVGRTLIWLDRRRQVRAADADVIPLSPRIREDHAMQAGVNAFMTIWNAKWAPPVPKDPDGIE